MVASRVKQNASYYGYKTKIISHEKKQVDGYCEGRVANAKKCRVCNMLSTWSGNSFFKPLLIN